MLPVLERAAGLAGTSMSIAFSSSKDVLLDFTVDNSSRGWGVSNASIGDCLGPCGDGKGTVAGRAAGGCGECAFAGFANVGGSIRLAIDGEADARFTCTAA